MLYSLPYMLTIWLVMTLVCLFTGTVTVIASLLIGALVLVVIQGTALIGMLRFKEKTSELTAAEKKIAARITPNTTACYRLPVGPMGRGHFPFFSPSSLTDRSSSGTISETLWIKHGQKAVIHGIAPGTTYTIAENDTTMNNEGHTTTASSTGDTDRTYPTNKTPRIFSDTTSGLTTDATVTFINNLNGVVPTGILLTYTPYIIISVIAVAGIVFLAVHRRRNAE
jgi:hypothetical protein